MIVGDAPSLSGGPYLIACENLSPTSELPPLFFLLHSTASPLNNTMAAQATEKLEQLDRESQHY
jgi:hypothetical protein